MWCSGWAPRLRGVTSSRVEVAKVEPWAPAISISMDEFGMEEYMEEYIGTGGLCPAWMNTKPLPDSQTSGGDPSRVEPWAPAIISISMALGGRRAGAGGAIQGPVPGASRRRRGSRRRRPGPPGALAGRWGLAVALALGMVLGWGAGGGRAQSPTYHEGEAARGPAPPAAGALRRLRGPPTPPGEAPRSFPRGGRRPRARAAAVGAHGLTRASSSRIRPAQGTCGGTSTTRRAQGTTRPSRRCGARG